MIAALDNFRKISAQHKIVFLGEMAELGVESLAEHQKIATLLAEETYDKIILVGENFKNFSDKIKGLYFDDSEKATTWLKENPIKDSVILIKGSRSSKMEKIMEAV